MASTLDAGLCALVAATVWTLLGLAIGRRVLPDRALVLPLAPALGWASFSAAALPVFLLVGFTRASVGAVVLASAAAAIAVLTRSTAPPKPTAVPRVPLIAIAGAAVLACVPAAAVMPKLYDGGVSVAVPIFDHAKVALIDGMVRLGLPPVNPVFGEVGGTEGVSYYYLWHFTAAVAARITGAGGWAADAALTWFTAWSSLMLAMGLAVWLGKRARTALWVLALAPIASSRPVLEWMFGDEALALVLTRPHGLEGWLFQASWSPQHLQSACCALLTMLLIALLPYRRGFALPLALAFTAAAGFQSSLWIGGVVVPVAAATAGIIVLRHADGSTRRRIAITAVGAAALAVALSSPLLVEQYRLSLLRAVTNPLAIAPLAVLGPMVADPLRRILDIPAFWSIFLVVQFPAVYPLGMAALARIVRDRELDVARAGAAAALAALAMASLLATWLLVSTVGQNNDLGWRAILPGLLILTALAAAGLSRAPGLRGMARIGVVVLILLGLPHTIDIARGNLLGLRSSEADSAFARSPELWAAVRRHAAPADRIANNPLFLQDATLWPANISWALLADRSSCWAGRELALAFAPLPSGRRTEIEAQFVRVFEGDGTPDDLHDLAWRYDCRLAVVTSRDGAWRRDPFARSPHYLLAEGESGRWRIYVRRGQADAAGE